MTALLRYQAAVLLRSNRWIFPLIAYGALIGVGAASSTPLGEGLDWSAAMLVPVVAFLTRSMLLAEPDASRACVAAAAGPARAQLATLTAALGGGIVLGTVSAVFTLLTSEPVGSRPASGAAGSVTATIHHPQVFLACLLTPVVCLLVGAAVGALCNPPLLRHPGGAALDRFWPPPGGSEAWPSSPEAADQLCTGRLRLPCSIGASTWPLLFDINDPRGTLISLTL